jgi:transcriptional/translational regulatory protein YebC/TACO1
MKEIKNTREIDFNKLIKVIVRAAKEGQNVHPNQNENVRLVTTLKLEVTVSRDSSKHFQSDQKNSTRLVMLTISEA